MTAFEVILLSVALAMDACALAMTNGMTNPKMPLKKSLLVGGFFGFFQFLMPLIGYFITHLIAGAFLDAFEKISAIVSFALLAFLGGKMLTDAIKELRKKDCCPIQENAQDLTISQLFMQAIATSIDALAVGVTLQMAELSSIGLAFGAVGATVCIGVITFALSVAAVYIGKAMGNKLADKATLFGGTVLLLVGLKILLTALL